MLKRAPLGICLSALLLATSSAGATGWRANAAGGATAQAYAIRVLAPGAPGGGAATPTVSAPPDAVQFSGGFSYGNGIVTTGSANASVSAVSGTDATASASAEVSSLSIFGGEITASDITAQARAEAKPGTATGDSSGSNVTNLVALGQPVANGATVSLADWGTVHTIEAGSSSSAATGYRGFVTAVDIHLTADHGGLPAGSSILIGYASVAAQAAPQPPPTTAPGPTPRKAPQKPGKQPPAPNPVGGIPPLSGPLGVAPPLHTPGGNVFPVYGPSSYTDTYGAPRSDVSGGWHHGDDIFAPLGAPVLAVASGTVFSVGWNQVGGNRLWLRDGAGNEYYYAHLSAYTPLARNGAVVNAGDVLGFVGNTGDAQGTPYHLHFEVHPVGLLGLGYDGAVDPTTYLNRWRHVQDVSFAGGTAWVPAAATARAPKPGAILISSTDISSANGLEPGSLQRVLAPQRAQGVAFPATAPVQQTQGHRSAAASH